MRYEISLELENEKIVQDYRRKCMSLLKAITEDYNPSFKEKQYGENKIKDFTFAINLPFEKVEGSFWQTGNEYTIYVYHRPWGERYDKLIGVKSFN